MPRTTNVNRSIVTRIAKFDGYFKPRFKGSNRHVEADLSRQVLALVVNGKTVHTYHTSSGTSSTPTVKGNFRFYLKTPGTNSKGMFYSSYFIRGYAIHGYPSVPTGPASHGCLRIPNLYAKFVYNWIHTGYPMHVYR
jgi:lipoprotein-anchoring transpeptidase ErfK/SrfK